METAVARLWNAPFSLIQNAFRNKSGWIIEPKKEY